MNTFKEMVQGYTKVAVPIDEITEASPLFRTSLWQPTNNGFSHKYEDLKSIMAAEAVNLNGVYPTIGADFNLKDRDIAFYAGTKEVHVNTVDQMANGNLTTYLNKQMNPIFGQTLNNISFDFYYNVLRPFGKAKNKFESASASDGGDIYSSLFFVRWQQDNMSGLVNDNWASAKGGVFKAIELNGGKRYKDASQKSVYGVDIEMPLGFLPANSQNVSGIVNIDLATIDDKAFGRLVTDMIMEARPGSGGKLVAYGSARVISRISQLDEAQNMSNGDKGIWSVLFQGVEFVADYNLLNGTEAFYTL
jgi:hypothetical protein